MIYNSEHTPMIPTDESFLSANHKVFFPIILSVLILLGLLTVLIIKKKSIFFDYLCFWFRLRTFYLVESSSRNRILTSSQSETPSIANIMSKSNVQPNSLPAVRTPHNNNLSFSSVDSNKYKMEGNGTYGITKNNHERKLVHKLIIFSLLIRIHRRLMSLCNFPVKQTNI